MTEFFDSFAYLLILKQDVSRLLVDFDARIERLHAESETIASSSLQGQTGLFPVTSVTGLCTYKQPSVSLLSSVVMKASHSYLQM